MLKNRDTYLNKLIKYKGKDLIKVISGVRRCGKSSLLDLYEQYLLSQGIDNQSIIRINFESMEFAHIRTHQELNNYILTKVEKGSTYYLLIDEVQQVESWEKAINSLRLNKKLDIYITGSNAYLLASELATLLSGRYIEIKMFPLSFKEYLEFNNAALEDYEELFNRYFLTGGFPILVDMDYNEETCFEILDGIYNTIVMKDVIMNNEVRDADLLEKVNEYILSNVGNFITAKKVSDYLTSTGRKTSSETIDSYINMLEKAFLLYKARKYDVKDKSLLKTQGKYYVVDLGLRNKGGGGYISNRGSSLENLVYIELVRRGYAVSVGSLDNLEIDFIAEKNAKKIYYQVTEGLFTEEIVSRETKPLLKLKDNYKKVIVSKEAMPFENYKGIEHINIIDFLLEE